MKSTDIQTRSDFIVALRAYIGTPFRHQGRSAKVGLDCLGLIICGLQDIGFDVTDNLNYGRQPDFKALMIGVLRQSVMISRYDTLPGDALWIKWPRDPYPYHLAVISGITPTGFPATVIHADGDNSKRVTEHTLPEIWLDKIAYTLRFKPWIISTT